MSSMLLSTTMAKGIASRASASIGHICGMNHQVRRLSRGQCRQRYVERTRAIQLRNRQPLASICHADDVS